MEKTYVERSDELFARFQHVEQAIHTISTQLETLRARSERVITRLKAAEQRRVALHWRIVQQQQGYVISQCAWCGTHLSLKWEGKSSSYSVSHGICLECSKILFGEDT